VRACRAGRCQQGRQTVRGASHLLTLRASLLAPKFLCHHLEARCGQRCWLLMLGTLSDGVGTPRQCAGSAPSHPDSCGSIPQRQPQPQGGAEGRPGCAGTVQYQSATSVLGSQARCTVGWIEQANLWPIGARNDSWQMWLDNNLEAPLSTSKNECHTWKVMQIAAAGMCDTPTLGNAEEHARRWHVHGADWWVRDTASLFASRAGLVWLVIAQHAQAGIIPASA
jgi:hypothetical protein